MTILSSATSTEHIGIVIQSPKAFGGSSQRHALQARQGGVEDIRTSLICKDWNGLQIPLRSQISPSN
ncbi:hypothetical protein BH09BAC3_BH09BAC3_23640 [soil metagenome]